MSKNKYIVVFTNHGYTSPQVDQDVFSSLQDAVDYIKLELNNCEDPFTVTVVEVGEYCSLVKYEAEYTPPSVKGTLKVTIGDDI